MKREVLAYPVSGHIIACPELDFSTSSDVTLGKDTKKTVEGTLLGRPISLFERPYCQEYVENWKLFRDAGLPVVPTVRKTLENSLLVTNVKSDGSETYGKGMSLALRGVYERNKIRPDIDKLFLKIAAPKINL